MKRTAVIKKLRAEAKRRGLEFEEIALTRHDAYRVGNTTRTLGRHREIDDVTARKFFDQYAEELGKGWWR
nr:ribonuclease PH [Corynebacterium lactis]